MSACKYLPRSIKKPILDLPNRSRGADYVVGGGVQDVFGGVVVQHYGIVMGGLQILGTPWNKLQPVTPHSIIKNSLPRKVAPLCSSPPRALGASSHEEEYRQVHVHIVVTPL